MRRYEHSTEKLLFRNTDEVYRRCAEKHAQSEHEFSGGYCYRPSPKWFQQAQSKVEEEIDRAEDGADRTDGEAGRPAVGRTAGSETHAERAGAGPKMETEIDRGARKTTDAVLRNEPNVWADGAGTESEALKHDGPDERSAGGRVAAEKPKWDLAEALEALGDEPRAKVPSNARLDPGHANAMTGSRRERRRRKREEKLARKRARRR